MNKYTIKATAQILGFIGSSILASFIIFTLLDYFQPSVNTVIFIGSTVIIGYILYVCISIQASILESRDKLKNRE